MRDFFNGDSKLMRILAKLFDIGYLSILFILFCVPIVTIGASLTALYYTTVKVIRHDRGYVFQEFWHAFKLNFVSATIMWIIQAGLAALLWFNMTVTSGNIDNVDSVGFFSGMYLVLGLILYAIGCYAFPVLSRFMMNKRQIARMSLYLAIRYIYVTIPLIVISGASVLAIVVLMPYMPIIPIVVPALAALLYSYLMEFVLKKFMPKEEKKVTEDGEEIVEWYNE